MASSMTLPVNQWIGCYDEGWGELIVPQAYGHPAKYAPGLIRRIVEYGLERGWFKPGDVVCDPFGGVGLGGIVCAYHGLAWIGVELELKFHRMVMGCDCPGEGDVCPACAAEKNEGPSLLPTGPHHFTGNFELHRQAWLNAGLPLPVMLLGDSRNLSAIVEQAGGIVTSPPFSTGDTADAHSIAGRTDKSANWVKENCGSACNQGYGSTPGQIGRMKSGNVDACITSPPYDDNSKHDHTHEQRDDRRGYRQGRGCHRGSENYGQSAGQIGNLPARNVDAAIFSPPYMEGIGHRMTEGGPASQEHPERVAMQKRYTDSMMSEGNIADLKPGSVDGVLTSPPYAKTCTDGQRENRTVNLEAAGIDSKAWLGQRRCTQGRSEGYGSTPGNLGNLKEGRVDSVITSPPFEQSLPSGDTSSSFKQKYPDAKTGGDWGRSYGESPNQIGNSTGDDYWHAMRDVYSECWKVLKPQGVLCVVLKGYIKQGKYIDLPGDTLKLLVHLGFEPVERIHAMLRKEWQENTLFEGEITKVKERKSFFRRLAEKRGSPKIDYEVVLFVRKP